MTEAQILQWIAVLRSPGFTGLNYLDVMKSVMLTDMYRELTDSQKFDLLFLVVGMARAN